MKSKKSQMALEFVLLFSLTILVMSIVIVVFYELNSDKIDEKIDMKMNDFLFSVQSEFLLASQVNNGYNRQMVLPEKIEQTEYNISIDYTNIILTYNGVSIYRKIPLVNGTIVKGANTIVRRDGIIYLNP
ncbi:MAG: hypothetical protein ACP5NV_02920 [Candidatus Woesearchaeota archaeon]